MKRILLPCLLLYLAILSCEYSKSVNKDFTTGLTTRGDGLSCDDVYLSTDAGKIERNTFTYGEKIFLNFDDIKGFKRENGRVFPGMSLYVTGQAGDTLLKAENLYTAYPDGIDVSPLLLSADLTVADPMHSTKNYTLKVAIWDKKGKGTFSAQLDFNIIPNERITIYSDLQYDEIYLFSRSRQRVVTDHIFSTGEDIYLLFEGLRGFVTEGDRVFPGLSVKAIDADDIVVMDYQDLFEEYTESGVPEENVRELITAQLSFPGFSTGASYQCIVTVWDKKSNKKTTATATLKLQ